MAEGWVHIVAGRRQGRRGETPGSSMDIAVEVGVSELCKRYIQWVVVIKAGPSVGVTCALASESHAPLHRSHMRPCILPVTSALISLCSRVPGGSRDMCLCACIHGTGGREEAGGDTQ